VQQMKLFSFGAWQLLNHPRTTNGYFPGWFRVARY